VHISGSSVRSRGEQLEQIALEVADYEDGGDARSGVQTLRPPGAAVAQRLAQSGEVAQPPDLLGRDPGGGKHLVGEQEGEPACVEAVVLGAPLAALEGPRLCRLGVVAVRGLAFATWAQWSHGQAGPWAVASALLVPGFSLRSKQRRPQEPLAGSYSCPEK
jgi:hypothetical protein